MVHLRFLVSSQPFFIFSGCLMSIIKLEGSSESTFSMNRVRCCTSFTNLARCSLLVELEKWPPRNEVALGLDSG